MSYNNTIGEKKAIEIAKYLIDEATIAKVDVPCLKILVERGAKSGILLDAYDEVKRVFNNGKSEIPVIVAYDFTNLFHNFVISQLPTKSQIETLEFYGKGRIMKYL